MIRATNTLYGGDDDGCKSERKLIGCEGDVSAYAMDKEWRKIVLPREYELRFDEVGTTAETARS